MAPSSFWLTISQIAPAGCSPASRARSTAASVWPGRRSTPPSLARSGTTWPGLVKSSATAAGSASSTHGGGPVGSRNTGSHILFRVDGDGVGGAVLVLVDRVHRQQAQPVADLAVQRHAQIAGGVAHHERHEFGVAFSAAKIEIALVLAILVVDHHHGLARRDVGYRPLDGIEPGHLRHLACSNAGTQCGTNRRLQYEPPKSSGYCQLLLTGTGHRAVPRIWR